MKKLELKQMECLEAGTNGQDVINCINDAYSQHGWASVGLFVVSIFYPAAGVMTAVACAARNTSIGRQYNSDRIS